MGLSIPLGITAPPPWTLFFAVW